MGGGGRGLGRDGTLDEGHGPAAPPGERERAGVWGAAPDESSALARAAHGVRHLLVRYVLGFALNFAGSVVVGRALGPLVWGWWAASHFLLTLYMFLALGGWGFLIQRGPEPTPAEKRTALVLQQAAAFAWTAINAGALAWAAGRWSLPPAFLLLLASGIAGGYFYSWRYLYLALAERRQDFRLVGRVEVLDIAVFNAVAMAGVALGRGLDGLLLANVLRAAVSAMAARIAVGERIGWGWDPAAARRIVRFAVPFVLANVLQWLPVNAGAMVVGTFAGGRTLGFVSLAYRFLEYPRFLLTLLFRVAFGSFSRHNARLARVDEASPAVERSLQAMFYVVTPVVVLMAASSPLWIRWAYGGEWAPAAAVLTLGALPFLLGAGLQVLATALNAGGHAAEVLRYQVLSSLLFWTTLALAVPKVGWVGLPASDLVAVGAGAILLGAYRRRVAPLALRTHLVPVLCAVPVAALGWLAAPEAPLALTATLLLFLLLWLSWAPGRRDVWNGIRTVLPGV